ncbi:hypothetical protein QL285_055690 [Trifolium repens]|nr:hypothetical protein QL285_055690 [Trifolium repens]
MNLYHQFQKPLATQIHHQSHQSFWLYLLLLTSFLCLTDTQKQNDQTSDNSSIGSSSCQTSHFPSDISAYQRLRFLAFELYQTFSWFLTKTSSDSSFQSLLSEPAALLLFQSFSQSDATLVLLDCFVALQFSWNSNPWNVQ